MCFRIENNLLCRGGTFKYSRCVHEVCDVDVRKIKEILDVKQNPPSPKRARYIHVRIRRKTRKRKGGGAIKIKNEGFLANLLLQAEPALRFALGGWFLEWKAEGVHVELFRGLGGRWGG